MKKALISLLIILLCAVTMLVSCDFSKEPDNGVISPEGITISDLSLTMYVGDTYQLSTSVYPINATVTSIDWSSSSSEVASVVDGKVFAHKVGKATIRAKLPDSKTAACNVSVINKPFSEEELKNLIKVNLPEFPMLVNYTDPQTSHNSILRINGAVVRMSEQRVPQSGENAVLVYIKFDAEKVYDSNGKKGLTPVYLKAEIELLDGSSQTKSQEYILERKGDTAIKVGDKIPLSNPEDIKNVSLSKNEMGIAFYVTKYGPEDRFDIADAVREFNLTLGGENPSDIVTEIPELPATAESISLSKDNLYLMTGTSFDLVATVLDIDGDEISASRVVWKSMNESVATCEGGVVTAHSAGVTAITATIDGKAAVCAINVLSPERMISLEMPELPLELEYISASGARTTFSILGYSAEYSIDNSQSDVYIHTRLKFTVKKLTDSEGEDRRGSIAVKLSVSEGANILQMTSIAANDVGCGETAELEYSFGSRFNEGKRTYKFDLQSIDLSK